MLGGLNPAELDPERPFAAIEVLAGVRPDPILRRAAQLIVGTHRKTEALQAAVDQLPDQLLLIHGPVMPGKLSPKRSDAIEVGKDLPDLDNLANIEHRNRYRPILKDRVQLDFERLAPLVERLDKPRRRIHLFPFLGNWRSLSTTRLTI